MKKILFIIDQPCHYIFGAGKIDFYTFFKYSQDFYDESIIAFPKEQYIELETDWELTTTSFCEEENLISLIKREKVDAVYMTFPYMDVIEYCKEHDVKFQLEIRHLLVA